MATPQLNFRIEGLRELERNLLELANEYGPRNALSALRQPVRNSLRLIAADIEANTPVESGSLRESVGVSVRMRRSKDQGPHVPEDAVLVGEVGWRWRNVSLWRRALAIEFGTRTQSAQSVLRDALGRSQGQILNDFSRDLGESIMRTARRLERRSRAGRLNRR